MAQSCALATGKSLDLERKDASVSESHLSAGLFRNSFGNAKWSVRDGVRLVGS